MPSYNFKCVSHGIFIETVSYEDRDVPQICPECGELSPRTWEGHISGITMHSYVDGRTSRFQSIKTDMMLRKAKAGARAKGDIKESDKIERERRKVNQKG